MRVRIRFGKSVKVAKVRRKNRRAALAIAALLMPAALAAWALAFWRLAADLNLAGRFAITSGPFSHWQVWMGLAALLQATCFVLNRYGRSQPPPPGAEEESFSPTFR